MFLGFLIAKFDDTIVGIFEDEDHGSRLPVEREASSHGESMGPQAGHENELTSQAPAVSTKEGGCSHHWYPLKKSGEYGTRSAHVEKSKGMGSEFRAQIPHVDHVGYLAESGPFILQKLAQCRSIFFVETMGFSRSSLQNDEWPDGTATASCGYWDCQNHHPDRKHSHSWVPE